MRQIIIPPFKLKQTSASLHISGSWSCWLSVRSNWSCCNLFSWRGLCLFPGYPWLQPFFCFLCELHFLALQDILAGPLVLVLLYVFSASYFYTRVQLLHSLSPHLKIKSPHWRPHQFYSLRRIKIYFKQEYYLFKNQIFKVKNKHGTNKVDIKST